MVSFREERLVGSTGGAQAPCPPAAIYEKPRDNNPEDVHESLKWERGGISLAGFSHQPLDTDCDVGLSSGSGFGFLTSCISTNRKLRLSYGLSFCHKRTSHK